MAKKKDLKTLVGQLFLVGFDGYSPSDNLKKFIQEFHLGGVIYFKKNVQSSAQLAELSNEIQFQCRPKDCPQLFISIDHEGGKVNRLVKPFTKFPGQDHLGEIGSPKIAFDFGMVLATELKAIGVNVNFAPVVDVLTNSQNTLMKGRCFSNDPEVCARLGSAVIRGIQKMGVMAVAKHYPGHGDTVLDSHFELPKLSKSWKELESRELIPFRRAIRSKVDGIMTAHILNKSLDDKYPATLSTATIQYLRNEMRFGKIIFSDDLDMKAVADQFSYEEASILAIEAGVDVLIIRGEKAMPFGAAEAMVKALEKSKSLQAKAEAAVKRILEAKKLYANLKKPIDLTKVGEAIGLSEHFKLAEIITKKEKSIERPSRA